MEGAGRAREGRGRGGGQLGPRPPSRRKCDPGPLRRSGERPSSSPGGRPLGVCAHTPELMFNGNQRWKQTLEGPVLSIPAAFTAAPRGSHAWDSGGGFRDTHVSWDFLASQTRDRKNDEARMA